MGVRFHKVLGYGITGLSVDSSGMHTDDSRLNLESPALEGDYDDYTDTAFRDHLEELTKGVDLSTDPYDTRLALSFEKFEMDELIKKQKGDSWEVIRGIVYQGEYGDASTLVIIPPGMSDSWSRYGDTLDHVEAQLNGDDGMPLVRKIDTPLYPFYGWMNSRTGEPLSQEDKTKWDTAETLLQALDSPKLDDETKERLRLLIPVHLEKWGFSSIEEYKETIVPSIPESVKEVSRWLEIFTSEDGWKDLRPMLYTYWG